MNYTTALRENLMKFLSKTWVKPLMTQKDEQKLFSSCVVFLTLHKNTTE